MNLKSPPFFWVKEIGRSLFIFSPLFFATYHIYQFGSGRPSFLAQFNNISGNSHPLNNVLLVYIAASYAVVLLGLVFYFFGVWADRRAYRGDSTFIQGLNLLSVFLIIVVIGIFVRYAYFFSIACAGYRTAEGGPIFHLHRLIFVNKLYTLRIFVIFFFTDLILLLSHHLQLKENRAILAGTQDTSVKLQAEHALEHNENEIEFSKSATFLINIPAILITLFAIGLTIYLEGHPKFRSYVDQKFFNIEIPNRLDVDEFDLFLNGIEAGVITSTIIFSQFLFTIIKTKYGLKLKRINEKYESIRGRVNADDGLNAPPHADQRTEGGADTVTPQSAPDNGKEPAENRHAARG